MRFFVCSLLMILLAGSCIYAAEPLLLSGFEGEAEWRLLGRATVEPVVRRVTQGTWSLKVNFPYGNETIKHGIQRNLTGIDLTGCDFIKLDVYNPEKIVLPLGYDIVGGTGNLEGVWQVQPGASTVTLPITKLAEATVDLTRATISIYMDTPQNAYFMYFDNLRAEKDSASASATQQTSAAKPAGVKAVRFAGPPEIDGKLDDQCWERAARVEKFVDIYKANSEDVSEQTTALIGYDDENLYFACICQESRMDKIRVDSNRRDFKVYDDDCIEIFLQPANRGSGDYLHFEVNSKGMQGDEKFKAAMMNIAWDADWRAAASREDSSWTVEVAIPFSCLELSPGAGSTWGFNIARHQTAKGEFSAVFATFGGFHVPSRYGDLSGLDLDLRQFCFSLENVSVGKGKAGQNKATMVSVNDTGSAQQVEVELRLTPENGQAKTFIRKLRMEPGSRTPVDIPYRLMGQTKQDAQIVVRDAVSKTVRHLGTHYAILPPPPIALTVTRPNYDNTIFAGQDVKTIEMTVDLNAEPSVLKKGWLEVTLAGQDEAGRRTVTKLNGKESAKARLDARRLALGSYTVKASLVDKDGNVVASEEQQLRKVEPHVGEVRIDQSNNLLVDGKPFFPVGMFQVQVSSHLAEMKAAGMNTVQTYAYVDESALQYTKDILDNCGKHGLKMVMQIPQEVVFFWKGKERDDFIRNRVNMFKDHPALLAWYIADEPDTGNPYASPETLREVRDFVKSVDPYHPVTIAILFPGRYAEYAKSPDILMGDPYLNWGQDGPKQSMEMMSSSVDAGFAATENKRPFWVIPSVFDISMYGIGMDKQRCPNYREIRCQTYMTVTHGVKGIVYYNLGSHPSDWVPEHVGTWYGFKAVTRELSELAPVLLASRSVKPVRMTPEDKEIHCSLREVGGALYLMAVNSSKANKKISFHIPGLKGSRLKVISEGRAVALGANGLFEDEFDRYDVHIYTNAAEIPSLPITRQIEAKCEKLDKEFEEGRKSNLAAAKGVVVEASSEGRRATSAIDGIYGSAWADSTRDQLPDWWQIDFGSVKSIRKILLDSEMKDYEIKAWDNGDWKTIAQATGNVQAKTRHEFREPLRTQKVRIYCNAVQRFETTIAEAEFYE